MAHPARTPPYLLNQIEEYETLQGLHVEDGGQKVSQRMADVTCTLCVATGTRAGKPADG